MGIKRPPRLSRFDYLGKYRYFLTLCAARRRLPFLRMDLARAIAAQFLQQASESNFAVPAYCVMPDHLHALLRGLEGSSDFRRFVASFKQRTGFAWKRCSGERLWQEGYYDRVLREEETDASVIAYIVSNPVSARLVESPEQYALLGSSQYSVRELVKLANEWEQLRAIDRGMFAVSRE